MASNEPTIECILSNKELRDIPQEVSTMQNVNVIDLSNNSITVVKVSVFSKLLGLKSLILSSNMIESLADDISSLQSLEILRINHNKLKSTPSGLYNLTKLVELDLEQNNITELVGPIYQLTALKELKLKGNQLRTIPADIGWLPLTVLTVEDNPLRLPPVVISQGFKAIMSYLQVVGEQHRLVTMHLEKFVAPAAQVIGNMEGQPVTEQIVPRLGAARGTGILDLRSCPGVDWAKLMREVGSAHVADVSFNGWKELPPEILGLNELVVLNASENEIEKVSNMASATLGVLNLSFNRLSSLPSSLGTLTGLQQLYLASNQLTDLPSTFARLPLVDLFLSENNFVRFPPAICGMKSLVKLSMACCQLVTLPPTLGAVSTLKFLDVSFNKLQTLPSELSTLESLNAFNLSFNPLTEFPKVVATMTALLEINLDYTGIAEVPPEVANLKNLEGLQMEGAEMEPGMAAMYKINPLLLVQIIDPNTSALDLSDLGLTELPPKLFDLAALTALDLSKNKIETLPLELGRFTGLKKLELSGNPLAQPWATVAAVHGELSLVDLMNPDMEKLDLSECRLKELPEWVIEIHAAKLQQLKLANNRLKALPSNFSALTALVTLVLDGNSLKQLPEEVLSLPSLCILVVNNNGITELPEDIGRHTHLQALVLQDNKLTKLPESLGQLKSLKAFSVSHNKIEGLPQSLASCSILKLLDISFCGLAEFPAVILSLTRLRTLKAAHNAFTTVPKSLTTLHNLHELYLVGNSFQNFPGELNGLNRDATQALISALTKACPNDQMPVAPSNGSKPTSTKPPAAPAPAKAPAPVAAAPEPPQTKSAASSRPQSATPQAPEPTSPSVVAEKSGAVAKENSAASSQSGTPSSRPKPVAAKAEEENKGEMSLTRRLDELSEQQIVPRKSELGIHVPRPASANRATAADRAKERERRELVRKAAAEDPLRPAGDLWANVPLMEIPRVIAAITTPPPPPIVSSASINRPQNMHRFKRVVEQSSAALAMLHKVSAAMEGAAPIH